MATGNGSQPTSGCHEAPGCCAAIGATTATTAASKARRAAPSMTANAIMQIFPWGRRSETPYAEFRAVTRLLTHVVDDHTAASALKVSTPTPGRGVSSGRLASSVGARAGGVSRAQAAP